MDRRLYLICEQEDGKKVAVDIQSIVAIDELDNGLCKLFIEKSAVGLESIIKCDFDKLMERISEAVY